MPTTPFIPIARPWMGKEEAEAAARPIEKGWVLQGAEVEAFEQEFAEFVGAPHAVAVASGTAAIFLALVGAGVQPGDEVVTVSHSFIATANVVLHAGGTPVFVDIVPHTLNINSAAIDAVITPRTRAVLVVHQLGLPAELAPILDLARRRGLTVVEDAACAIGSELVEDSGRRRIGLPHGHCAAFSFHPRKLLATGDGGMVTTRSEPIARRLRRLRNHGLERRGDRIEAVELGWNYRMTDVTAAVGRVQLNKIERIVARRREQAARYTELLDDLPVTPVGRDDRQQPGANYQSYAVWLDEGVTQGRGEVADGIVERMAAAGIGVRPGIGNAHDTAVYAPPQGSRRFGCPAGTPCPCGPPGCTRLPHSARAATDVIMLPIYHDLTVADQQRVVRTLRRVLTSSRQTS